MQRLTLMMTPAESTRRAKLLLPRLLQLINAKGVPIAVPILPEPDAVLGSCFYNVQRKVNREGGKSCYGWAVRLTTNVLEVEKHAIWLSPKGEYWDVTPITHVKTYTEFVVDDEFVYQGQLTDNIRLNISDNKAVDDLIKVNETIGIIWTYGSRLGELNVSLPNVFAPLLTELIKRVDILSNYIDNDGSYDTPCFCGSDNCYKLCHGRNLREELSGRLSKAISSIGTLPNTFT